MEPNTSLRVWFQLHSAKIQKRYVMSNPQRQSRVQDEIEKNLKRAYDDVASEDLPDRFAELLQTLRSGGSAGPKNNASAEVSDE